jgi:hypothetical protein
MEHFAGSVTAQAAPSSLHAQELLEGLGNKGPECVHDPFFFSNGKELCTLEELAYYLRFVSEETFSKHVHEDTNDYALWIEHSLGLSQLARQVSQLKDQFVMSKLLMEYIHMHH